jgi:hypothetical protein
MRAGQNRRSTGVATLGACLVMMAVGLSLPAGSIALPRISLAQPRCVPLARHAPCLGRIQSEYSFFTGQGSGAVSLIRVTHGPREEIGRDTNHEPILRRTFTWHSVSGVRMRAVYVVSAIGNTGKYRFRPVPTKAHHGQVTLKVDQGGNIPRLLLEGERTASKAVASVAATHCKSFTTETPCIGPIQTLFAFTGMPAGAVHSITVKRGSEEEVGTNPEGVPIEQRRFTWHSVASVKLVAASCSRPLPRTGKPSR